jgi:hypothetical protein
VNLASAGHSRLFNQGRAALLVLALSLMLPGIASLAADPDAAVLQDPERAILEARVRAVRELLTTLDGLQAHLAGLAETALNHADAAPTLDERRRYERLYTETSARLGELQATRAEIERQIDLLETQLETAPGGR